MLNPLRRLVNRDRAPMRPRLDPDMAMAMRRNTGPISPRSDDYLVEGEQVIAPPSVTDRVLNSLQILLILVLAVLSLGVFWLLGLLFNIL